MQRKPTKRRLRRIPPRPGKRAHDREKLLYLAAIVDSTGEAIFSYNLDGIITTWNSGATLLFGYSAAEMMGQPVMRLIPDHLKAAARQILADLRQGVGTKCLETVRVRKGGTKIDVHVTISPIKGPNGKIVGGSSIAYNITERKRAEDERTRMIQELNETLSKVRTLSGLLPICAACKKIRDDKGYWQKLETFVHEHSNAEFSHSICPDCMHELYPDFAAKQNPRQ